jgi:hypothetical protein
MPDDRFITRDELRRRLVCARVPLWPDLDLGSEGPLRPASEILKAACEILARGLVPVRGRRPDKLISERIEHWLRSEQDWWYWLHSGFGMLQTEDAIFLYVVIDWPALVAALAEAGFPVADPEPQFIRSEDKPPRSGKALNEALNQWAWDGWGPDFETLPDRDKLLKLAREPDEVSPNVTREQIRALRRRLAPEKLRRGGAPTHRH